MLSYEKENELDKKLKLIMNWFYLQTLGSFSFGYFPIPSNRESSP